MINWQLIILTIIGIIIIYIFFKYAESETKKKFLKIFLPIVVVAGLWLWWRNSGGFYDIKKADFFLILAIFVVTSWRLFIYEERYHTFGQVIADNYHGSYYTPPVLIGNYIVFNVGSFCYTIPWARGNATLIVPSKLVHFLGKKAYCKVQVTKRDLYKLPLAVVNYVLSDKDLNKKNVYFGMFDAETNMFGKEIKIGEETLTPKDFVETFLNMNAQLNRYQGFADGRSKDLEDYTASMERIGKKITGGKFFKIFRKKEEEEE